VRPVRHLPVKKDIIVTPGSNAQNGKSFFSQRRKVRKGKQGFKNTEGLGSKPEDDFAVLCAFARDALDFIFSVSAYSNLI
jgi:hypothetical protein